MAKSSLRSIMRPASWQRLARRLHLAGVPLLPEVITLCIRFIFSCYLSHHTKVGNGLVLGYGGLAIVIHKDSVIGDDCHIDQCVTIGGKGTRVGVPTLGDRVYVGAGAKLLGDISIGDDAVIGANAVVLSNIPAGSVAVGVPARIVNQEGSDAQIP